MININLGELSPLDMTNKLVNIIEGTGPGINSLPEFTSATRLMPTMLVDQQITLLDEADQRNIIQTMVSIFAAHYLQAVALSVNIGGVNTISLLDQFSTDRKIKLAVPSMSMESADLPGFALEADKDDLQSHTNLAIGRLLHVKVGVGDKQTTIPVTLTAAPRVVPSKALPSLLAMTSADRDFKSRFIAWQAGEIKSFTDFAFGLDLIEKDKKALLNDEADIYKKGRRRETRGVVSTVLSGGKGSYNTASTMAVISKATAEELELALKGRLSSAKVREKYFKDTYSMMLVVVDARMERLTIYQRGIEDFGRYTFSDIEDHGKKSGSVDVGNILKAYKLGEAPSL